MKRTIILAAMAVTFAACENVQDPTSVDVPEPQMTITDVTVTATGGSRYAWLWSGVNEPATYNSASRTLKFTDDPVTGETRQLTYNRGLRTTSGTGILTFADLRGTPRLWQIDLTQPRLNRTGNYVNRTRTTVKACLVSNPANCQGIRLTW